MDRDGVVRTEAPRKPGLGLWLIGLAVVFTVGCLVLSAWLVSSPEEPPRAPEARAPRPTPKPAPAPVPVTPTRVVERPSPQPAAVPPPVQEPQPQEEAVSEPPPEGQRSGLALFVPGTKPIKKGIVVPEDFPLPPGFVRHYQTTDDGQMLQAILMFHPDYKPVDANGQPVPLPENRVVPPEMAPPGLPITLLDVPEGKGGGGSTP